jgi:hypothetical protein
LPTAEAKLAETQRAFELRLAEAKRPQAKPAVETRPGTPPAPNYAWCETCGTISAVTTRYLDRGGSNYEVRVVFRDGTRQSFVFSSDPGFSTGERVRFESGRLTRM